MPRLTNLRSRVEPLRTSRVRMLETQPETVERLRGRAGMERRARWLRVHPFCVDCLAETPPRRNAKDAQVDHEIPLWKGEAEGGVDEESNFATRCRDHHAAKTAREAAERARCYRGTLR